MAWTVEFYTEASGHCPVQEFLDGLPVKDNARIVRAMNLLEKFGLTLRAPYVKHLTNYDLWELRVQAGRNDYRVFYFAYTGQRFVMLHGLRKKTQKTPPRDLEVAQRRMKEFLRREDGK